MEEQDFTEDVMDSDIPQKKEVGGRHRKKQLYQQIMKLMEFYLSDSNLRKDRFFNKLLQENPEIEMDVFLKCNKLAQLTNDPNDIVKALKQSKLLEVTEDKARVRRTKALEDKPDIDECTIYVEKLPPDAEHDWIEKVFSEYGKVAYISLPKFKATGKIKGFAFIEFTNKEEANKALQAYNEMGCRLPSNMPPETLYSIKTFEGEQSNLAEIQEKIDKENKKRDEEEGEENNEPPAKKVKITNKGVETVEESHTETETDAAPDSDPKKESKSRRKKKKAKQVVTEDKTYGMHVLSKIEWKKLRNQYLTLQRSKMKKLKTHLQNIKRNHWRPQYEVQEAPPAKKISKPPVDKMDTNDENQTKSGVEVMPGTILRIQLDEPLVDVKLFKNELRHKPNIKYIDANAGSQEVFIRCINPEETVKLAESKTFPVCDILKGEEEEIYREKIEFDRKVKFSTKPKVLRGRTKLLKKAEKALSKHIRFDHTESVEETH